MQQLAEPMDPRLVRLLLHLCFRRVLRRPEGPEATLLRFICRLPLDLVRCFLPTADAAPQPRERMAHRGRFLLNLPAPHAPLTTTSTAPATVSDLLLLVAVNRYIRLLTPRAAALEGRAPAAPIVLLLGARGAVLRRAAPPSASDLEGRVVEDALLVAALYGCFRQRTAAALGAIAEAPLQALLQRLYLAFHRRIRRAGPGRGASLQRLGESLPSLADFLERTQTVMGTLVARCFAPRAAARRRPVFAPPGSLHHLQVAFDLPHAPPTTNVSDLLLVVAVHRYVRLLTQRAAALEGRALAAPMLLILCARGTVLCRAAPRRPASDTGRVVDALFVAAVYGRLGSRTAEFGNMVEAPPLALLQRLRLALHRRISRVVVARLTLLDLVLLIALCRWLSRSAGPRTISLRARFRASPASLLRCLQLPLNRHVCSGDAPARGAGAGAGRATVTRIEDADFATSQAALDGQRVLLEVSPGVSTETAKIREFLDQTDGAGLGSVLQGNQK